MIKYKAVFRNRFICFAATASLGASISAQQFFVVGVTTATDSTHSYTAYSVPQDGNLVYKQSTSEYGPEITLSPSVSAANIIRSFDFSYFANYAAPASLVWTLYANDGPNDTFGRPTPGSVIDNDTIAVVDPAPGTFVKNQVSVSYSFITGNVVPKTMTLTVKFDNGGNLSQLAGLQISSLAPTVGTSPQYYWENSGTGFYEAIISPPAVPEPTSTAVLGVGLSALAVGRLLVLRNRR